MSAFKLMLQSRKFWGALATIICVVLTRMIGGEAANEIAFAISAIGSVYVASVAYEDGHRSESNRTPPPPSMNLLAALLLPALLLIGGCAGPDAGYVAADRATFAAVAPEYRDYVQADPALSPEQKSRRNRTIDTWRLRLEQAETRQSAATQPTTQPTSDTAR